MELNYSKKERTVGIFVVLIAILLLSTLVMIGRGKEWFKKYISYYTVLTESYNLNEGAAVKLFKTDIGKVQKISILENRVRVDLIVLEDFAPRIRVGAVAVVESPTFIGSEYISIKPGPKESPLILEGGLIPSVAKRSIADLLDEFQVERTAKMFVQAVQDFSDLVHQVRDPQGPLFRILNNIERTTAHIEALTGDVQAGKGTAGSLLKSDELLDAIRENLKKAENILDHIARASAKMPGEMDRVSSILNHIDRAASKAPETMGQVQDGLEILKKAGEGVAERINQIKGILNEVEKNVNTFKNILDNIEEGSLDIPKITRSTHEGIREIREGLEDINSVVKSLKKNILIRRNLPPEPIGTSTDAGLRK